MFNIIKKFMAKKDLFKDLETKRILIVEDDKKTLNLLHKLIAKKTSFHIDSFDDEMSSLRKIREIEPDLIILDLHLRTIHGPAFKNLAEEKLLRKVPTIFISGSPDFKSSILRRYRENTFFMAKPFNIESLIYRINSILK